MDNYIVINGKRIDLTEDQVKALGFEKSEIKEAKKDYDAIFRRELGKRYCFISTSGRVDNCYKEDFMQFDKDLYDAGNYCYDMEIMQQRAWHEVLNRRLWRASVRSGELDRPWDKETEHYYIYFNTHDNEYETCYYTSDHIDTIYFPSEEAAQEAIDMIVKPFVEAHPKFKW